MKSIQATIISGAAVLVASGLLLSGGCGGGFLRLEDYQRDLILGGLAAALLNQPAPDAPAGQPVPGADGVACWDTNGDGVNDAEEDTNGDGVFNALDCQGAAGSPGRDGDDGTGNGASGLDCWDLNGNGLADDNEDINGDGAIDVRDCRGDDGANGADGSGGSSGPAGADGPEFFDIYVDDFFTFDGDVAGIPSGPSELQVNIVAIDEPFLGEQSSARVAFRTAIPELYHAGNDVSLRLFFNRTGPFDGDCFVFTLDAVRLKNGFGVEAYGTRQYVRVDLPVTNDNGMPAAIGELGLGVFVDLPINTIAGLGFPNDLKSTHFLAVELGTFGTDGGDYQLLGAEFIESGAGSATARRATIFDDVEAVTCAFDDCNGNGFPDDVDIAEQISQDCNENGIPDECDIENGESQDCNADGTPDECEPNLITVLSDGTFVDSDWVHMLAGGTDAGASTTAAQQASGGNPDAYQQGTHTWGPGFIGVAHISTAQTFDPSSQGAIASVAFAFDVRDLDPSGTAVAVGVVLRQGGQVFKGPSIDTVFFGDWVPVSRAGLVDTDFGLDTARTPDLSINPDFSQTGGPIELGYTTLNDSNVQLTLTWGVDNFSVTVEHRQPNCDDNIVSE